MARKYVLDTHALIWYLEGNTRLGKLAREIMSDYQNILGLPVIALAEAIHIVAKGRTGITSVTALLDAVKDAPHVEITSLTWDVLQTSVDLTTVPEIHDRLIMATAVHLSEQGHEVFLLTQDREMVASGLMPIVWDY